MRFTRTQCGFELRNDPTRAETTQPVPEPCGRFGSGPLPTDLAKASGVSLRFRGIYFGILGISAVVLQAAPRGVSDEAIYRASDEELLEVWFWADICRLIEGVTPG